MKLSEKLDKAYWGDVDRVMDEEWIAEAAHLEAVAEAAKALDYDSPMRWSRLDWIRLDAALAALEERHP